MEVTDSRIQWRVHPARERLIPTTLALLVIAATSWGAMVAGQHVGYGILAAVVLVGSLHRYFFVSRYTIDRKGITARSLLKRQYFDWSHVRRVLLDARGGYLSTRHRSSRWDAFRGMHILFPPGRADLADRIRSLLGNEKGKPWAG
jgi:hypothetical protein